MGGEETEEGAGGGGAGWKKFGRDKEREEGEGLPVKMQLDNTEYHRLNT